VTAQSRQRHLNLVHGDGPGNDVGVDCINRREIEFFDRLDHKMKCFLSGKLNTMVIGLVTGCDLLSDRCFVELRQIEADRERLELFLQSLRRYRRNDRGIDSATEEA